MKLGILLVWLSGMLAGAMLVVISYLPIEAEIGYSTGIVISLVIVALPLLFGIRKLRRQVQK